MALMCCWTTSRFKRKIRTRSSDWWSKTSNGFENARRIYRLDRLLMNGVGTLRVRVRGSGSDMSGLQAICVALPMQLMSMSVYFTRN